MMDRVHTGWRILWLVPNSYVRHPGVIRERYQVIYNHHNTDSVDETISKVCTRYWHI